MLFLCVSVMVDIVSAKWGCDSQDVEIGLDCVHLVFAPISFQKEIQIIFILFCPRRENNRAVASLTVPGGQEFHFPHFFLKFWSLFLNFPQTFLIFFLILALRVGESPTREGPGYATDKKQPWGKNCTKFVLGVKVNQLIEKMHMW